MNFAVAATTLAFVIPAELPDKTFISCVVLASRYRPFYVWIGAASGLVVQAGFAVVAGGLLAMLPHRAVEGVVAGLFFAGAIYLLLVSEKKAKAEAAEIAEREEELVEGHPAPQLADPPGDLPAAPAGAANGRPRRASAVAGVPAWRIIASTFGVIVLAEFGDITQVLVANLTAHYHDQLSVFAGAAIGFSLVAVIGVVAGAILTRKVPLSLVRKLSGVALGGFGVYSLVSLVNG